MPEGYDYTKCKREIYIHSAAPQSAGCFWNFPARTYRKQSSYLQTSIHATTLSQTLCLVWFFIMIPMAMTQGKLFKIFYNKFFLTWCIGAYLSFSVTPNVPVTYIALNISLPTSPGLVTISCNQCFSVNKWLSSGTKFSWWEKGMHDAALLTRLKFSTST